MTQPLFEARHTSSPVLDVSCRISTAKGWLELQSPSGFPYSLGGGSFAQQQRTQRRTEATNPFVRGTFTVNSVPENITETVEVWVDGDSHYEMEVAVDVLVAAFEQVNFLIKRRVEDSELLYYCFASDVMINTQREFLHARKAMVSAQVPRLPRVERSMA